MIRINDDISIVVVGTTLGNVRLGIIAPKDVKVHREEVYQSIKKDKDADKRKKEQSK